MKLLFFIKTKNFIDIFILHIEITFNYRIKRKKILSNSLLLRSKKHK